MEPLKTDSLKLPNMVMCGDHPSVTKTELNLIEVADSKKDNEKKLPMSYTRISPTSSRTDKLNLNRVPSRPMSEHTFRPLTPRSPAVDTTPRQDNNRELLQAAIGSFRWPPYLVLAWLLLLAAAHALHAIAAALAAALPTVRKLCKYFRAQTAESWQNECELAQRLRPILLGMVTAALYALLGAVAVAHAVARWAVEPLAGDADDRTRAIITNVTDYDDFARIDDVKKMRD